MNRDGHSIRNGEHVVFVLELSMGVCAFFSFLNSDRFFSLMKTLQHMKGLLLEALPVQCASVTPCIHGILFVP